MIKEKTQKKIVFWWWFVLVVPVVAAVALLLCVWNFAEIPSFAELEHPDNKLATQLISADGKVLSTFHLENRTYIPYEQLSPYLVMAAEATEDVRFRRHCGIDFQSLARVGVKTILLGDSRQGGGSTITQQLAKTLYPRQDMSGMNPVKKAAVMVWTKLTEWITAVKLERAYTKNEILGMYLNSVFFGSGAYGVKAAAQTYFSKDPEDLTLEEAATLIGIVNKPTRYNPHLNPENSRIRRNFVISQMEKAGRISLEQSVKAQAQPIVLHYQVLDHNSGLAPYFRDMLRREMLAKAPKRSQYRYADEFQADSLRWVEDRLYGWITKNRKPDGSKYNLDSDGLRIYTTIDSRMQLYAEQSVREHLSLDLQDSFNWELEQRENAPFMDDTPEEVTDLVMEQARKWSDRYRGQKKAGVPESDILASFDEPALMRVFAWNEKGFADTLLTPNDSIRYVKSLLRAAFYAIEPGTGHVKAYVGGPDYRNFKYDNIRQGKRQVGSTIKPFLYTLAMQEGLNPCYKVVNMPQSFKVGNKTWTPRSTDSESQIGRTVTLKWGLTHSSNNISAYLMKQFGPQAMARMMHKMGVSSHLDEVYSLCVGPADLNLYEIATAYNVFPSKGVYCSPLLVTKIEDNDGNVLAEFDSRRKEVLSEQTAYLMVNLMEGVIKRGTGVRLGWKYGIYGQVAGKTGTTNDNSDGWFIGYTPQITAGVWCGAEDRMVHFEAKELGQGSNTALPIWGLFMQKCYADSTLGIRRDAVFTSPDGLALDLSCDGGDIERTVVFDDDSAAENPFE